jgi:acyl-CoA synthetase (AMP-forming)/AMP-acid ligase II
VNVETLIHCLLQNAEAIPQARAFTHLVNGEEQEDSVTWAELLERVQRTAHALGQVCARGDRVLVLEPTGLDFVQALCGSMLAGLIAVPIATPHKNRLAGGLARLHSIVKNCQPSAVLGSHDQDYLREPIAQACADRTPQWLTTAETSEAARGAFELPRPGDVAFLQYTSGSTGNPKGVMVLHSNIIANVRAQIASSPRGTDGELCTWLPLFHDMGLISIVMRGIVEGCPVAFMSPMKFIEKPIRWLRAMSRRGGVVSGGPNFAYDLCARKVREYDMEGLDLSRWRYAYIGAEPIRADTLRAFLDKFGRVGFAEEAYVPCYGLAECTVYVSGGAGVRLTTEVVATGAYLGGRAIRSEVEQSTRTLVGCGPPAGGSTLLIVDAETRAVCPDRTVGEIWLAGPSVAAGYWDNPDATFATFDAQLSDGSPRRYLRTGDLGFLANGQIYVSGRRKDVVIVRGKKIFPEDVEKAVCDAHRDISTGDAVAFEVDVAGEERLVVLVAVSPRSKTPYDQIIGAVRLAVGNAAEVQPHVVGVVNPRSLLRTSSGKIRRGACAEIFRTGVTELLAEHRVA